MKRSEGRILTSHVGSIIRPPELLAKGRVAEESAENLAIYEKELSTDVSDVVEAQADAGLDVINDGEFGKSSWANYILGRISGYEIRPDQLRPLSWLGRDRERFRGFFESQSEYRRGPNGSVNTALSGTPAEVCVAPIEYLDHRPINRDLANLTAAAAQPAVAASGAEIFFTTVAPASTAYQGVNEFYKTEEEYIYAIADALRVEYKAVIDAGFVLQVDDAVLANMYDHYVEQGEDVYKRWAQLRVEALNHALEGIPSDRVRYHICFGSWHVPHVADAPMEAIVPFMLQVNAGAYSIEAANPRHEHEWTVWKETKLPDGKILIPGIVSHHSMTVEHPKLVAQRIERYSKLVGAENLIAGTDCGFAQGEGIQRVHPEVMWAKYSSLVEGAAIASSRIFS